MPIPARFLFGRCAAFSVLALAAASASAVTITFNGFGGVNEDDTPDNGDAFASYSEAGFTLTPTGGSVLVAKATGNDVPAIYVPSDGTSGFGRFDLTAGGARFTFAAIDIAAITSNVSVTFTGMLGAATAYSFTRSVAGHPFVFGSPVLFDTVPGSFAALAIDRLTVALTGGGTSFTIDNINVTAVPEPSSAALLGLGLAGLAVAKRRRA